MGRDGTGRDRTGQDGRGIVLSTCGLRWGGILRCCVVRCLLQTTVILNSQIEVNRKHRFSCIACSINRLYRLHCQISNGCIGRIVPLVILVTFVTLVILVTFVILVTLVTLLNYDPCDPLDPSSL